MTSVTNAVRALLLVAAFLTGELGVFFLGLALAAMLGFASSAHVWALPLAAFLGVVLVAITCALIFLLNLDD